jgi:hypothetical protein
MKQLQGFHSPSLDFLLFNFEAITKILLQFFISKIRNYAK